MIVAMRWGTVAALLALCCLIGTMDALTPPPPLPKLSPRDFIRLSSTAASGTPEYWIIRIAEPAAAAPDAASASSSSSSNVDVLAQVAQELAPHPWNETAGGSFVHFGELLLDSKDAWTIADVIGFEQFPVVIAFGCKSTRAVAPRGGRQYGRLMPLPILVPVSAKSTVNDIRTFVLANVPTRYHDGVTTQSLDALNMVFTRKEVYQLSAQRRADAENGIVSFLPRRLVVVRLRLSAPGDEAYLAAVSAQAAQSGSNVVVVVTEDEDVAARFGIASYRGASAFAFPLPEDVSIPIAPLSVLEGDSSPSLFDLCAFVKRSYADLSSSTSSSSAESSMATQVASWQRDISAIITRSPLVKLNTASAFQREVVENKMSIIALFFLRESDDFFMKAYHTAVDVARAIQTSFTSHFDMRAGDVSSRMTPHPLRSTLDKVRFEAYWVDAEVHKDAAHQFKAVAVPSVAFLYGLVDGKRGVRYVFGGKKNNEFPSAAELLSFMGGSKLLDTSGRDMFPLDLSTVHFASDEEVSRFYRSQSPKKLKVHLNADAGGALTVDRKLYVESEKPANPFVAQMVEGKIVFEKQAEDSDASAKKKESTASKKLNSKKEKKKAAEKKKLEEELLAKKIAREERMKKKAAEDAVRREEEKARSKDALKADAKRLKEQGGGGATRSSSGASEAKKSNVVERPKFSPAKGIKNRHQQKREWEVDRKAMMEARLKKVDGKVQFPRTLE